MNYQIVENDVRLLRRILIALQLGDQESADKISGNLRSKGMKFILPEEQTEKQRKGYLIRLLDNEKWLSEKYGCILYPDGKDCIFLNSMWRNPKTLYVRLVEPVEELGDLGVIYWIPSGLGDEEQFREDAERNHQEYLEKNPSLDQGSESMEEESKPWYKKLFRSEK